ncbi:MAG: ABC transporter permease [Rhodopirellula sp.]|nr:ABC transporter permease [Rhodopirellula sp.]
MVIESEIPQFTQWIGLAAVNWLIALGCLGVIGIVFGYLVATLRNGPAAALGIALKVVKNGIADLAGISPRRVMALARLAVKEAIRRRVVVAFAVFIVVLLFAGWFLDPSSDDPARLYLGFVLTMTSYLVLLLVLFLSALSLPADITSRTLHTVVTKPVRSSEIVLGRMLGFAAMGTGLLLVMAVVSYFFVVRGLNHTHVLADDDLVAISQTAAAVDGEVTRTGLTSRVHGHRHKVTIDPAGYDEVDSANGHRHSLKIDRAGGKPVYRLGPAEGMLLARVPVYGKLRFRDRDGKDTEKGINVGDEWFYRSYVQGGSPAAAIWTFSNITPERFSDGLPVEMNIGVFRTYKGNIEKGVFGSLSLRNPKTGLTVETEIFESKEFDTKEVFLPREIKSFSSAQVIPRQIVTAEGEQTIPPPDQLDPTLAEKNEFGLYEDLVADGQVEVWLRCLEPSQYFGAGQPDLYLRASDASFMLNFAKGYLGIWLQMLLVIGFGVMFSTFLSGPVAMVATLGVLVGGMFSTFLSDLAKGAVVGGGPIESLIRLVTQQNVMTEMDPGLRTEVAQMFDRVLEYFLLAVSAILPPFREFNYARYVAYGFDISGDLMLVRVLSAAAYLLPVFLAAYFFLKTREVAR